MKRKIFLGATALMLATAGVFAGRLSSKFSVTTLYLSNGAGGCTQFSADNNSGRFALTGTTQAQITTSAGANVRKIWTNSSCSTPVYLQ